MSCRCQFSLLALFIAVVTAGCCFHTDLTRTPDVQQSGMLGLQLRTTQELVLIKDKHSHTLLLATKDHSPILDDPQTGVVEAGTILQINEVVRVKELMAILVVLPEYFVWDCTLARVKNGPYAGKEVAIAGEGLGLSYDEGTVMLGSSFLRPVNQASMLSALNKGRPYSFPPVPATYDFYDSKSNQFATVTLILPVPFFPDKLDGMWFGSLAKSYVRPKSEFILASDKLNVHDLHRLTGGPDFNSKPLSGEIYLYSDVPNDQIILFMPISETNGPVRGNWIYQTDGGEVESGTFAGPT